MVSKAKVRQREVKQIVHTACSTRTLKLHISNLGLHKPLITSIRGTANPLGQLLEDYGLGVDRVSQVAGPLCESVLILRLQAELRQAREKIRESLWREGVAATIGLAVHVKVYV